LAIVNAKIEFIFNSFQLKISSQTHFGRMATMQSGLSSHVSLATSSEINSFNGGGSMLTTYFSFAQLTMSDAVRPESQQNN
jgi:hypothetical protein